MKKYVAGFIGAGNMGGALLECVIKKIGNDKVVLSCSTEQSSIKAAEKYKCDWANAENVVKNSDFVFVGIKPQNAKQVLEPLAEIFSTEKECVVVSMLAGKSIEYISQLCSTDKIIRIMPNTPVSVGCGTTLVSYSKAVTEKELDDFLSLISMSGKTDVIPESLIDAGCALSGCGPAFVYMFIEALSDGAVKCGLPREKALTYAAQTLLGASQLMLQTESHPAQLKDAVCSPGGSTVAGVASLENNGFRCAAIEAVVAAFERTRELGNS